MKKMLKIALMAAAAAAAFGASAQEFPAKDKTVTIVVPFAAGGPTDRVARDLAEALRKPLGATVVVDNTAGAGSSIGAARVARANPDGYTLLLNHIGMSTMPALYRKLSFSVPNDFEYLGMVNEVPMTLIGKPQLPANTYRVLLRGEEIARSEVIAGGSGWSGRGCGAGRCFAHRCGACHGLFRPPQAFGLGNGRDGKGCDRDGQDRGGCTQGSRCHTDYFLWGLERM